MRCPFGLRRWSSILRASLLEFLRSNRRRPQAWTSDRSRAFRLLGISAKVPVVRRRLRRNIPSPAVYSLGHWPTVRPHPSIPGCSRSSNRSGAPAGSIRGSLGKPLESARSVCSTRSFAVVRNSSTNPRHLLGSMAFRTAFATILGCDRC